MFDNFLIGVHAVFRGIGHFYHHLSLWKYAIMPLSAVVVLYGLFVWGGIAFGRWLDAWMKATLASWPQYIAAFLGSSLQFMIVVLVLLIIPLTISSLYEMFGGLFFDYLIAFFAKKEYSRLPAPKTTGFDVKFILQSCIYSINTILLMILIFILGLFIPVAGQVLLVIFSGYRFGVAYLSAAGYFYGCPFSHTKKAAGKNFPAVLGFGVVCYFLLQIPFAMLFILPGLVIGGMMLFTDREMWLEK